MPNRRRPEYRGPTITEAEALLPQARKVAEGLKVPFEEAPLSLGFISTDPIPEKDLERGRELAREKGWI